jgi:hypothetical protein
MGNKRLMVAAVVALAVLALCVTAAPAFAAYPNTLDPGIAAVHPWWGAEPVIWEECDADGNWWVWSAAEPAYEWAPYKAIPPDYDVWFAGWIFDSPRGQMARSVGTTSIDCKLYNPDGTLRWSIKPRAAKKHWGPVMLGWESQLINKEVGKVWVIGWTYDLGRLPSGTYSGTGTWASTVPAVSLLWSEDEPDQRTPTHYSIGVWDCTYTFTVQ